jgi:hypothetical protein
VLHNAVDLVIWDLWFCGRSAISLTEVCDWRIYEQRCLLLRATKKAVETGSAKGGGTEIDTMIGTGTETGTGITIEKGQGCFHLHPLYFLLHLTGLAPQTIASPLFSLNSGVGQSVCRVML